MIKKFGALIVSLMIFGCAEQAPVEVEKADLILENGNLYSLSWDEPSLEGVPAANAPYSNGTWAPDGEAVAIKDGVIIATGTTAELAAYKGEATQIVDLNGSYILPGLVDSHTHINELGATFDNVDLFGVETEEEVTT